MRKYAILFLALLTSIYLTGCWDTREINELGLVMAVGVDKSESEEGGYRVSVQIAKPSEAAGGTAGGGGGSAVWIGAADGKTVFDAIRNIAKFSSRRVMWAHNNVIVIGEKLAREGITPVMDFFTHNPELRMKTWVAVTRGNAESIVAVNTGIEKIPAISISRLYLYSELPAKSIKTDMVTVFRDYKSDTIQPVLSVLRLITPEKSGTGSSQVELEGGAIFKEDKLMGYLSPDDARGIAWLRGQLGDSIVTVSIPGMLEKRISVELKGINVDIEPEYDGERAKFNITLKGDGSIVEQDYPKEMKIEQFKAEVQKAVNERVKREVEVAVDKVQTQYNVDIIGLGRRFHIKYKSLWNSGLSKKWPELYSSASVNVNCKVNITNSSLFQVPIYEENIQGEGEQ